MCEVAAQYFKNVILLMIITIIRNSPINFKGGDTGGKSTLGFLADFVFDYRIRFFLRWMWVAAQYACCVES